MTRFKYSFVAMLLKSLLTPSLAPTLTPPYANLTRRYAQCVFLDNGLLAPANLAALTLLCSHLAFCAYAELTRSLRDAYAESGVPVWCVRSMPGRGPSNPQNNNPTICSCQPLRQPLRQLTPTLRGAMRSVFSCSHTTCIFDVSHN